MSEEQAKKALGAAKAALEDIQTVCRNEDEGEDMRLAEVESLAKGALRIVAEETGSER